MNRTELSAAIDDWWAKRAAWAAAIDTALKAREGCNLATAGERYAAHREASEAEEALQAAQDALDLATGVLSNFGPPIVVRGAGDALFVFHRGSVAFGGPLFERPEIGRGV